jgi:DNA-binding transcriptional ArsR family regulator
MSFRSPREERLLTVEDVRALRALAHPLRLALLEHLMSFGDQTASDCARVLGGTPSNVSYHLRSLARFGLVERAPAQDGREHPWRSTATGLRFAGAQAATAAAHAALDEAQIETSARLARAWLAAADGAPAQWRAAATMQTYALRLDAAELARLVADLDALIRPYIALTRGDAPEAAEVVQVRLDAFPHPDAP